MKLAPSPIAFCITSSVANMEVTMPVTSISRLPAFRVSTVVAKGAQSRRIKYLEVFERLSQGVRAGVPLETQVSKRKLRRVNTFEHFKGRLRLKYFKGRQGLKSSNIIKV